MSGIHAIVTISQATASVDFTFLSPSLVRISVIFPFLFAPSFEVITTSCPTFTTHS
jgi:hypothetical protein